jgi:hypothetical protein
MSSNLVTDNKFTTSWSRSRGRRPLIQDVSGTGVVIPPLLQKERRYRTYRLFFGLVRWYKESVWPKHP